MHVRTETRNAPPLRAFHSALARAPLSDLEWWLKPHEYVRSHWTFTQERRQRLWVPVWFMKGGGVWV